MLKARKTRLAQGVRRAAAFAMAAVLTAGGMSFDSLAADGADAGASANSVTYEVIDLNEQGGKLTVTNEDGVMTLSQSAETGKMPDSNVSYLVFPETNDKATLSLKLKVKSFNYDESGAGVFVGAFMPDNEAGSRYFMSMGFRNPAPEAEDKKNNSLSPYWWKAPKETKPTNIGNGSPKILLQMDTEYTVDLSWSNSLMSAKVTGPKGIVQDKSNTLSDADTGTATFSDVVPDLYDHDDYVAKRRFGIAIVGAVAEVTDMVYKDSAGNVLFDQNNVTEGGEIGGGDEPDPGPEADPNEPNGFVATAAKGDVTYTFDFADPEAKIYDVAEGGTAVQRTAMKSAGLVTVNEANKAMYWNDHGSNGVMNIDIAVAGTSKISIHGCQFSGKQTYAVTSATGTVAPGPQSVEISSCGDTVDYYYKGEAGSVNFASTGGYLHKIVITPIQESDIPDFGGDEDEPDPNDPDGFVAPAPVREITYTFDFADATAKIYDLKGAVMAAQGTAMKSAGLVTVNADNAAMYWNDHGSSGAMNIDIAVAGDCKINITTCFYSGEEDTYTLSSGTGTISDPATQNAKAELKDKELVTYTYTGGAGSVKLTSTGGYTHKIEIIPVIKRENRKIEVWDFGGVQENNTKIYHNNIPANYWTDNNLINTADSNKLDAEKSPLEFGDLTMIYTTGDQIRGDNQKYDDGYNVSSRWYCNGTGGTGRRCVTIKNIEAGDKVVAYMGSHNGGKDNLHFQYQGGDAVQDDAVGLPDGYKQGKKYEFIAKYDGTYKLYVDTAVSNNTKPLWQRVMVVPGAKVSGTVDLASNQISGYGLKFVNNTTEDEIAADVAEDGTFTVNLTPGYEYTAVLTGVVGYGITAGSKAVAVPDKAAIEGMTGVRVTVEQKDVNKFSGRLTGFAADVDLTAVKIILAAAADSQKENVAFYPAADGKFETYVESGVSYTITMEGVNDYELTGSAQVLLTADEEREVTVAKKATYEVSGSILGLKGDAAVTSLQFSNMEDDYAYDAAVEGTGYSVSLRNGTYVVKATVSAAGYSTISHVVVKDGAVNRDLLFTSNEAAAAIPFAADIYVGYPDKDNNYNTVKEAVRACEGMRLTNATDRIKVHIAPGVYREQVIINVPYVTFVNDEPDKEVKLTWYYGIGYVYYSINNGYYSEAAAFDKFEKKTADKWGVAVYVKSGATEFRAENITFEASFNKYVTEEEIADGVEPGGGDAKNYDRTSPNADVTSKAGTERASAIAVEGNRTEFYNCKFLGSQDTLYTGNNIKGYFKNCYIEGNTDYIFGGGDFVYDGCELNFCGYSEKGSGGYITAARDTGNGGYVFRNCYITGNEKMKVDAGDFGRPWGPAARVNYINTKLEYAAIILARGWNEMSGNKPENANYAEYNTIAVNGDKVDLSKRVAGVKTENPVPDISKVFNGWTPVYYQADTDQVALDKALSIKDPSEESLAVGDVLTADFTLGDNEYNNVSVIRWYRVAADGTEKMVKSSVAQVDRSYTVTAEDTGAHIKVSVLPETVSGYTAAEQTATSEIAVGESRSNPADYTKVDQAIAEAEKLNKADYVDFSEVEAAVKAVERGLTDKDQEKVNAMAQAIMDAIAGLKPIVSPEPTVSPDPVTSPSPSPDTKTVEEIIEDAMKNTSVDEALKEIVAGVEIADLTDKMQTSDKVLEQMKKLDEKYKEDKGITVDIQVAGDAAAEVDNSKVAMVGAAVNAESKEAILKISKPEKPVSFEDARLTESVQLDIKLTSGGKEIKTLKVPMTVTISVPRSLSGEKMDTLALLHYADDGSCERVNFRFNEEKTDVTFTISHFSTFVFAKESSVPGPEEDEDEDDDDDDDAPIETGDTNVVAKPAKTGDSLYTTRLMGTVVLVTAVMLEAVFVYLKKYKKDE